jgi:acetyl-CoA carboxylase carboxyl transferase subunit alpha
LLADTLRRHLAELGAMSMDEMLRKRYDKFRNIAQFYTV